MHEHWRRFGRHGDARHDHGTVETENGRPMMEHVRRQFPRLVGTVPGGRQVSLCKDFAHRDPVDGCERSRPGLRILLKEGARIGFRLAGTCMGSATMRINFDAYDPDPQRQEEDAQKFLALLIEAAAGIAKPAEFTGRKRPTVIT